MSHDETIIAGTEGGPTVIRPRPGGRRAREALPAPSPQPTAPEAVVDISPTADRNPLVGCASGLLSAAAALRNTPYSPDLPSLKDRLTNQINTFERCARAHGMTDKQVLPARYFICALLDEAILGTPWGTDGGWSERGLLLSFHNEHSGGSKFFDALDRLLGDPKSNLELLELIYVCLSIGFQGRYSTEPDGQQALKQLRERLYTTVRDFRGEPEPALSPHWQGSDATRRPIFSRLPLWIIAAISALALMGLFSTLVFDLHRASDPVFANLAGLGQDQVLVIDRPGNRALAKSQAGEPFAGASSTSTIDQPSGTTTPSDPQTTTVAAGSSAGSPLSLGMLLAEDAEAGNIVLVDRPRGPTVVLRGEGFFASGRADLRPDLMTQLARIAAAIDQLPGPVLVTGHTDSVPIRTLRFPSNQVLSQARADNVLKRLAENLSSASRLTAEGRADTEPLVPSDPRDSRNRRVEITLIRSDTPPAQPQPIDQP